MPPDNFGKYQSRLFNLFREKNRSWSKKIRHAILNIKVNANQSLEVILYSVILMMRKVVESSGKKLTSGRRPKTSHPPSKSRETQKHQSVQSQTLHKPKGTVAVIGGVLKHLESHINVSVYQNSRVFFFKFQNEFRALVYARDSPINYFIGDNKGIFQTLARIIELYIFRNQNNITQPRIDITEELPLVSSPSQKLPTPNITNSEITDPWLALNDLFGNYQDITPELKAKKAYSKNSEAPSIRNNWDCQASAQKLVGNTQTPMAALPTFTLGTTNKQLGRTSEYIDTQAKLVSYTQHPLERILQLLDNGMLWLEEQVIKVFNFFRQIRRKLLRNK